MSCSAPTGIIATRYSSGLTSLGTPTRMTSTSCVPLPVHLPQHEPVRPAASDKRGRPMIMAGVFDGTGLGLKIGRVVHRRREILPMLQVYARVVPPPHDF